MSPSNSAESKNSLGTHKTSAVPDWTNEMSHVLSLWAAQIDAAISESHNELQEISESYFSVAQEALAALRSSPENTEKIQYIEKQVHTALVKFQVSDRLMQRLMNVKTGLHIMGKLLQDESGHISDTAWQRALGLIRGSYTMAAERRMFDAAVTRTSEREASDLDIEKTGRMLILFDEE